MQTSDTDSHHDAASRETAPTRGKLKIFFGACAGVGKTYAMLSAGHQRLREGVDVLASMVETHGRPELIKLLEGMPMIPSLEREYMNVTQQEFDLDVALLRKPAVLLLDELAHANMYGARHLKRWSDIEELLDAGIDVYSTLSVQHLESLNDLVASTTGVWEKETVPDSIFDKAEDIVLIDINADELLKRLEEGKVHVSALAAKNNFFKKSNVIALRELALHRTAERVDAQMDAYKSREGLKDIVPVADKVIVCIGHDHLSEKLIRSAKRMAASLRAPWTAVYVENARHYRLSDEGKKAVENHLRMAERLGGKTLILQGTNAVDEIITYALENGITKIVIGKTGRSRWHDFIVGSLADKVIQRSGYIDVYVVTGEAPEESGLRSTSDLLEFKPKLYTQSLAIFAACTALGILLRPYIPLEDQMVIYLIGNILVSAGLGRGPSILYAILSAFFFDFFFTRSFEIDLTSQTLWMTMIVMLVTSLVINSYASRLRLQAKFARKRERNTQLLYAFAREIAVTRGYEGISEVTARHIDDMIGAEILVALPDRDRHLQLIRGELQQRDEIKEAGLMQWCFDNAKIAGLGTDTMPSAETLYVPLFTSEKKLGVLGLTPKGADKKFTPEQVSLAETFASLLASAVERVNTSVEAERLSVDAESEKLRNMLLNSVSHDLRSPLASITEASGAIIMDEGKLAREEIRDLAGSINQEASRLSRIITNLLDVMSLESGSLHLDKQPHSVEAMVKATLERLASVLTQHQVELHADPDLPMVVVDAGMIEQVIGNLLENAVKYTPLESKIEIRIGKVENDILVSIEDNGPGIPLNDERRIFDKFYTASRTSAGKGTGLGLAICQGIIAAHKGRIWAENRSEGGAVFNFTLPIPR
ncbi:MAG TPA: sensor histidine kinase KdpD [Rickettsiales bacterium]|nr:sensor histidine kinase KdpD [Rickettsiales bacterium]